MSVATFVIPSGEKAPEDPVVFDCIACETQVPAPETDAHATRKHKASLIRVFNSHSGYQDFLREEEARERFKALS